MKKLVPILSAAFILALCLPAMAASTARASATTCIYAGPSNQYGVVGRLPKGAEVYLARCTRSGDWCQLDDRRGGWVLASYLVGMSAKVQAAPPTFLVPFFGDEEWDDNWPGADFPF